MSPAAAAPPRLVLFPGMGADARMYAPLRRRMPSVVVPAWIPALAGEDLAAYARRYVELGAVRRDDLVGGSSFGGFLALEVARLVGPRGVLLLGSARSTAGFAPLAALTPLVRALPEAALAWPAAARALAGIGFGLRSPRLRDRFVAMVAAAPPGHLAWACGAVGRWPGVADPGCPVAQLHGAEDRIIPARRERRATVIPGAGHLLALTHPTATAAFARTFVAGLAAGGLP